MTDHGIRAYNSAFVVNRDGTIISYYDKMHLVPFGEYLAAACAAAAIRSGADSPKYRKIVSAGDERQSAQARPARRISLPLICYEAIFPERCRAKRHASRLDRQPDQ